jgi:hypothetical protein
MVAARALYFLVKDRYVTLRDVTAATKCQASYWRFDYNPILNPSFMPNESENPRQRDQSDKGVQLQAQY